MSKRWYQENKRDPWRRDAKSKGYRARSAYKLKQIQEKFGILRKGDAVLDIGCHPGGWIQVAIEEVGESGAVIGVDLLATSPIEGATIFGRGHHRGGHDRGNCWPLGESETECGNQRHIA